MLHRDESHEWKTLVLVSPFRARYRLVQLTEGLLLLYGHGLPAMNRFAFIAISQCFVLPIEQPQPPISLNISCLSSLAMPQQSVHFQASIQNGEVTAVTTSISYQCINQRTSLRGIETLRTKPERRLAKNPSLRSSTKA